MKVLNLQCGQQHSFEGWFGSEGDFQSQLSRGLVQCPLCGSAEITKKLIEGGSQILNAMTNFVAGKNQKLRIAVD